MLMVLYGFIGIPLYLLLLLPLALLPQSVLEMTGFGPFGVIYVLSTLASFLTNALVFAWLHYRWLHRRSQSAAVNRAQPTNASVGAP